MNEGHVATHVEWDPKGSSAPLVFGQSLGRWPQKADYFARFVAFLALAVALCALAALSGCATVTMSEYRSFVDASSRYYEAVDPTFREVIRRDAGLPEQSKKNRIGLSTDHRVALDSARARAGLPPLGTPARVEGEAPK